MRRRTRNAVAAAAILILLVGGAYAFVRIRFERNYARLIRQIHDAGEPLTIEELEAWYPAVPPETNAAPVLKEANYVREAIKSKVNEVYSKYEAALPVIGEGKLPEPGQPPSAELTEALEQYLGTNAELLRLGRQAAQFAHFRLQEGLRDIAAGSHEPLELTTVANDIRRLFYLDVIEAIFKNDRQRVVRNMVDWSSFARLFAEVPEEFYQINRFGLEDSLAACLVDTLERIDLDDETLKRLDSLLVSLEAIDTDHANWPVERALIGDRVMSASFYDTVGGNFDQLAGIQFGKAIGIAVGEMARGVHSDTAPKEALRADAQAKALRFGKGIRGLVARAPELAYANLGLWSVCRFSYLLLATQLIDASRKPFPECIYLAVECRGRAARVPAIIGREVDTWISSQSRIIESAAHCAAMLRLARTALAIERFRKTHDALPGALNDLVPEFLPALLEDPFNGEPLHYVPAENGYKVYSVGRDLTDDGGRSMRLMNAGAGGDIVFSVRLRP